MQWTPIYISFFLLFGFHVIKHFFLVFITLSFIILSLRNIKWNLCSHKLTPKSIYTFFSISFFLMFIFFQFLVLKNGLNETIFRFTYCILCWRYYSSNNLLCLQYRYYRNRKELILPSFTFQNRYLYCSAIMSFILRCFYNFSWSCDSERLLCMLYGNVLFFIIVILIWLKCVQCLVLSDCFYFCIFDHEDWS